MVTAPAPLPENVVNPTVNHPPFGDPASSLYDVPAGFSI
jgi:hypothetical protein